MSLPQSSERALTAVMAVHRTALQPILISPTIMTIPKRGFTWGNRHKWSSKPNKIDYAALQERLTKRPDPCNQYLERKLFKRHFLAARGWRSSSPWKNSTKDYQKNKESEKAGSKDQDQIYPEDWLSAWQLRKIQNFEAFKKKIDADPYAAIFGQSDKLLRWASQMSSETAAKLEEEFNILRKETKGVQDIDDRISAVKKDKASSQPDPKNNKIKQAFQEAEYDIDPITLRKIEKKTKPVSSSKDTSSKSSPNASDIPVKTFKPSIYRASSVTKGNGYSQVDEWLAREGFKVSTDESKHSSASVAEKFVESEVPKSKIQSSLDRHVVESGSVFQKKHDVTSQSETHKTGEGLNVLGKSNINADVSNKGNRVETVQGHSVSRKGLDESSGRQSQLPKQHLQRDESDFNDVKVTSTVQPSLDRALVSDAFESINDRYLGDGLKVGTDSMKSVKESTQQQSTWLDEEKRLSLQNSATRRLQSMLVPLKTQIHLMTTEYEALRRQWLEATRRRKEYLAKKVEKQSKLLNQEIEAQKLAMKAAEEIRSEDVSKKCIESNKAAQSLYNMEHHGEGDLAPNVAEFASRDRWYKRKAPHANCEMEAKTKRLLKEKALVGEIRGIYEDTYGTIDTNHRQRELRGGEGGLFPGVVDLAYPGRWYKKQGPFSITMPPTTSTPQASPKHPDIIGAEGDLSPTVLNVAYPDRWYKKPAPHATTSTPTTKPTETTKSSESTKPFTMLKDDPSPHILSSNSNPTSPTPSSSPAELTSLRSQLAAQARELAHLRADLRSARRVRFQSPPPSPSCPPPPPPNTPVHNHTNPNVGKKSATVKRTEPVFSGSKRAGGGSKGSGLGKAERRRARRARRRATLRSVLLAGGGTAVACYGVGVLAEWAGAV